MWQWCTVFCALCALKRTDEQAKIKVSTQSGRMTLTINENDDVCVNMGEPDFEPQNVPFRAVKAEKPILFEHKNVQCLRGCFDGKPHCVVQVDNVQTAEVEVLGPCTRKP